MICTVGSVVKSMSGHDKSKFYAVVRVELHSAWIADGKRRKVEKPKRKNLKHLSLTAERLTPDAYETNKRLRLALSSYREGKVAD